MDEWIGQGYRACVFLFHMLSKVNFFPGVVIPNGSIILYGFHFYNVDPHIQLQPYPTKSSEILSVCLGAHDVECFASMWLLN